MTRPAAGPRAPLAVLLLALAGAAGCGPATATPVGGGAPGGSASERPLFTERAAESGLHFLHANGMAGEFWMAEMLGSGAALLDYDGDGDLDCYLVQGGALDPGIDPARLAVPLPEPAPTDRLFRNELAETGRLAFTDVTAAAGIASTGYGMGAAAGDYDGDGDPDLYVTNLGPNVLLRNEGDGTFRDVTAQAGADDDRFSTSAAFVDYDRDGRLDLFVVNYVDFTLARHKQCFTASGRRDYCGPLSYEPQADRLLRNLGDGTFEDVSATARIVREAGAGLGVVAADFDADGWPDLYVANDAMANDLWINQRDGRFENRALLAGCAYNAFGKPEASMGVDAGDADGDGDDDLFMTHLDDETNTLYLNDGAGFFEDVTASTGLAAASRAFTGFGTAWFDFDNDGRLDLLCVNGAVRILERLAAAGDAFPLHQANQLFRNVGGLRFEEVSARAGPAFALSEVSRGAAFGDLDDDGDIDVIVVNNAGPARLLVNEVGQDASWLGLRLIDRIGGRDQVGARVTATLPDGRVLVRRARADGSYCSSNDPRVLFGLGEAGSVSSLRVRWPDGRSEEWDGATLALRTYHVLVRGSGRVLD